MTFQNPYCVIKNGPNDHDHLQIKAQARCVMVSGVDNEESAEQLGVERVVLEVPVPDRNGLIRKVDQNGDVFFNEMLLG